MRKLSIPAWLLANLPLFAAAIWATLLVLLTALTRGGATPLPACHFRALTGLPCAGCRGTRAAMALGSGDPIQALIYNPLATILLVGVPISLIALRWGAFQKLRPTPRFWSMTTALVVAAVIANWAYVLKMEG